MRIAHVPQAIELAWDENLSLLAWGPPGVGKTTLYRDFALKKFAPKAKELKEALAALKKHYLVWRLAELESVDMRGTPRERNGRTFWAPPEELPLLGDKNGLAEEGIILLDELAQARTDTKNVATRLLDERRIGEAVLKPGWRVFAASNRLGDAAGTSPMPTHLNNRFWHVEVETSITDWIDNFAEPNGVDERVVAYLKYQPQALLDFDPRSKESAFATPRSWTALAKMIKGLNSKVTTMDPALLGEYCSGHVGRAHGNQFAGFLRTYHTLVTIEQILLDPTHAPKATEPSVCYALATALAAQVDRKSIENAFVYLSRLGKEFAFVFGMKLKKLQPHLQNTKSFQNFVMLNPDF